MADQRLIVAIGRIERALSRIEQIPQKPPVHDDQDLALRHEALKAETRSAIADIDRLLASGA